MNVNLGFAHQEISVQIELLTEDISKNPEDATLFQRRGELLGACGSFALAQKDFLRCREINPEKVETFYLEGRMFLDAGRPKEAVEPLERFLSIRPDDPGAMLALARAKADLGLRPEAERLYAQSIPRLDAPKPDEFIEWAGFIRSDLRSDRSAEAIQILDQAVRRLGPVVTLQLAAIDLEVRLRRFDSSLARLDTILAQSNRKEAWLTRKGEILLMAGREVEARDVMELALAEIETLPASRRRAPSVVDREKTLRSQLVVLATNQQKNSNWGKYQ